MADFMLWTGPATAANLAGVTWLSPVKVLASPCGGPSAPGVKGAGGSTGCYRRGEALRAAGGLAAWVDELGETWRSGDRAALGAFSAGYGLVDQLLRDPGDRQRTRAVLLADAYFTGPNRDVKPGLFAYAERAARGDGGVFLATTSGTADGDPRQNGASAIAPFCARVGMVPSALAPELAAVLPVQPERVESKGAALVLHFGSRLKHVEHATQLARVLCSSVVAPALAYGAPSGAAPHVPGSARVPSGGASLAELIAAGVVAWWALS
jgi:hypothetical protein